MYITEREIIIYFLAHNVNTGRSRACVFSKHQKKSHIWIALAFVLTLRVCNCLALQKFQQQKAPK